MKLLKKLFSKYDASDQKLIDAIKNVFGFAPENLAPYKLACKHKSVAQPIANDYMISNERLEFLGDAILGSIIAEYLFKKFPYKDEGFLTEIRSRIVCRNNLNIISLKLGLNKLIKSHCQNNKPDTSIPGDAFEAFVGAIYLDKGYNFASKILINKIINCHIDLDELIAKEINFKSKLIEWGQKEKKPVNFYVVDQYDNSKRTLYKIKVEVDNIILGTAKDYSIKKAEQDAAKIAWNKIENGDKEQS